MAFADDLLEQAGILAKLDRNRPRQANLRRAISTAYYALFHLLIAASTANWKQARLRADLARGFEHRDMHQTCRATRNKQFPSNNGSGQHLVLVADNFIRLQAHRQTADYNNSKRWTKTETLGIIGLASAAFQSWELVRKETIAEDFLLRLLIPER